MKDLQFEFTLDYDGEVEDLDIWDGDTTEVECEGIIDKMKEKKVIGFGERTEGVVKIRNGQVEYNERVCMELGEDWDSDNWTEEDSTFPYSDL